MILCKRYPACLQRLESSAAVEPSGRNEAIDVSSDDVGEKLFPSSDPLRSLIPREPQELAFTGGHQPGAKAVGRACVGRFVAMEVAMKEHLYAGIRPVPEAGREGRPRHDRRIAPVIRYHEHRQPLTHVRPKQFEQAVDLTFETRRNIMDRHQEGWARAHRAGVAMVGGERQSLAAQ